MKIAFFGLGNMGLPVALNLVHKGHEVRGFVHRSGRGPEELCRAGGVICQSAHEAAEEAEVIFTIVPDDDALLSLMCSEEMISSVRPGTVIIDMTSCSAEAVIKLENTYAEKSVSVLDAPVSGGVAAAKAGSMTVMCAGNEEVFARMKPLLEDVAKNIFYVGNTGNGKRIKALNNLLAAINAIGICEVSKVVKKYAIDADVFEQVVMESSGASKQFRNNFKRIINSDFAPNFAMELMRKDVGLAHDMEDGLYTPLSDKTAEIFEEASIYDGENYTAIAKLGTEDKPWI